MKEKIKISYEELQDPRIDAVLTRQAEEAAARLGTATASQAAYKESFIYKSWFNLMVAGLIGAFIAWAFVEPFFEDENMQNTLDLLLSLLWFPLVGGFAGLMIGGMEGILARNYIRALIGALVGLGIGFGGGLVSMIAAQIIFNIITTIGAELSGGWDTGEKVPLVFFIPLVIGRSLGWLIAGMTVGLGPGIALKSKKLTWNGFIGGLIGGALGGLFFDPISYVVSGGTLETGVELSRALGFGFIGASAGLLIGLVDMMTKDAWLLMTAGPLSGKQFIVYKNPTQIGSSSKCDIYLFKDPAIEPIHADIHIMRDGYEIEDRNSRAGTLVNRQPIKRERLQNGDEIQIGKACFIYSEREKKK